MDLGSVEVWLRLEIKVCKGLDRKDKGCGLGFGIMNKGINERCRGLKG